MLAPIPPMIPLPSVTREEAQDWTVNRRRTQHRVKPIPFPLQNAAGQCSRQPRKANRGNRQRKAKRELFRGLHGGVYRHDHTLRPGKEEAPAAPQPAPEVPPQPRDATRAEQEEIVYLKLSELFPFKDHPFGVRDDAEMKGLVESVKIFWPFYNEGIIQKGAAGWSITALCGTR